MTLHNNFFENIITNSNHLVKGDLLKIQTSIEQPQTQTEEEAKKTSRIEAIFHFRGLRLF